MYRERVDGLSVERIAGHVKRSQWDGGVERWHLSQLVRELLNGGVEQQSENLCWR